MGACNMGWNRFGEIIYVFFYPEVESTMQKPFLKDGSIIQGDHLWLTNSTGLNLTTNSKAVLERSSRITWNASHGGCKWDTETKISGSSEPDGQPSPKLEWWNLRKICFYQLCVNCVCSFSFSWPSVYRVCDHSCYQDKFLMSILCGPCKSVILSVTCRIKPQWWIQNDQVVISNWKWSDLPSVFSLLDWTLPNYSSLSLTFPKPLMISLLKSLLQSAHVNPHLRLLKII